MANEEKAPLLQAYRDDEEEGITKTSALEDGIIEDHLRAAEAARLRSRRRRRRFFHFFALTFLTLAFVCVRRYKHYIANGDFRVAFPEDEHHHLPVVPGVTLEHCTDWHGGEGDKSGGAPFYEEHGEYYIPPRPKRGDLRKSSKSSGQPAIQVLPTLSQAVTSQAEFELEGDKPLYFVSRGSLSAGSLKVVQSEDEESTVKTTVKVTTDHGEDPGRWHEHFLDVIRVCKISRKGDQEATGVGIFTPKWDHKHRHHHWHNVKFDVTVELPKSKDMLTVDSLETDMPIFSHNLETEKGKVVYKNLNLLTALAHVDAVDATAENLTVFTANAPIDGNYKTSNLIVLSTSNAHIDVSLELENAKSSNATRAFLDTKNGHIVSRNTLTTSDWSETNTGNFSLTASTANAKIGLTFPAAPVNSTLALNAYTALGSIDASMHPTFEGTFFLTTKLAKAEVLASKDEADPEKKDRQRSVITHPMKSEVYGETWWGKYEGKKSYWGNAILKSALGPVVLRFDGKDV